MIFNPIMYSNGSKPAPVKPETCGTVSLDPRIQAGAEALFKSGQGWFEPDGPFTHKPAGPLYLPWFEISGMVTATGEEIPEGMKYPWEAPYYFPKGDYENITFDYGAPNYQGFEDGGDWNPPYIVRVSKDPFDLNGPRMYFHSLPFEEFIGAEAIAALEMILFGIDISRIYEEYPVFICDMVDTDGTVSTVPLEGTIVSGKLVVTMTEDVIQWAYEHIGMRGFTEWHVGHIG